MTTSAARTSKRRSPAGFTLLEIIVVLVIVSIVIGGAFAFMMASDDDRVLTRSAVEVEALAKRARVVATIQQRPYALEFYDGSVNLMPLAEAMLDPRDREKAAEMLAAQESLARPEGGGFQQVRASWSVDADVKMFVRRWSSEDWLPVNSKERQVWRFDPEGFCEPVGVRFEYGRSWAEAVFHPLTGGIGDLAKEVY